MPVHQLDLYKYCNVLLPLAAMIGELYYSNIYKGHRAKINKWPTFGQDWFNVLNIATHSLLKEVHLILSRNCKLIICHFDP